jgi:SET domain-containing protein
MYRYYQEDNINIKILTDSVKGRGVYADEDIRQGSLIETCHILLIDHDDINDSLEGYVYEFSSTKAALALGNGSLYNHSDKANASFSFSKKKKLLFIKATKNIKRGEEITIDYGYSKSDRERFNIR